MSTFPLEAVVLSACTGALAVGGFSVETEGSAGTVVVRPVGELDIATAPILAETFHGALRAAPSILAVDLSRLDFIDSLGVEALLSGGRDARASGCVFVLCWPRPPVLRVLRLTGLHHLVGEGGGTAGGGPLPGGDRVATDGCRPPGSGVEHE